MDVTRPGAQAIAGPLAYLYELQNLEEQVINGTQASDQDQQDKEDQQVFVNEATLVMLSQELTFQERPTNATMDPGRPDPRRYQKTKKKKQTK